MARRSRAGVTIDNLDSGVWKTTDRKYEITQVHALTFCDGPHPERIRTGTVGGRGIYRTGYCHGGEEHDYIAGWGVFDSQGREVGDDVHPTLNEAHDALANHIEKENMK